MAPASRPHARPARPARPSPDRIGAATAARLLLGSAGLLDDPAGRAGPRTIERRIEGLGFVQVDAIAVSVRAHHHILMTRHDAYRPATLTALLERERRLFEHWTHDASLIPIDSYAHWGPRFRRARSRGITPNDWWKGRIGPQAGRTLRRVLDRLTEDGPLPAGAVADEGRAARGGFWSWTPEKAALEYAWRAGLVAIAGRQEFTKLYDLAERVFPDHHGQPVPSPAAHVDWACRAALDRLVVATPSELAGFLAAIPLAAARRWTDAATRRGDVVPVIVEHAHGDGQHPAFARSDWAERAAALGPGPDRARPLSPFDPAIRDRRRLERCLGMAYRFEAFTPRAKRRYGYYVLPVLDGTRLTCRVDVKLERSEGRLDVLGWWWEPGVRPTRRRRERVAEGLARFAQQAGMDRWTPPPAESVADGPAA